MVVVFTFLKIRWLKKTEYYGKIVKKKKNGWGDLIPGIYVKSLSQEHGIFPVLNHL